MSDDLTLALAFSGDLEAWADDLKTAMLQGLRDGVEDTGRIGLERLRDDVREAGLGERLPKTWRLDLHPTRGLAYSPAAFIRSTAARIIDAFTRGAVITSRDGGMMAVPIPGGPMDRIRVLRGETSVDAARRRLGELVFVPIRPGLGMLVTKRVRVTRSGRFNRTDDTKTYSPAYAAKNIKTGIPVFWLVPQVVLARRLNWPQIARDISQTFGAQVEASLRTRIAAIDNTSTRGRASHAVLDGLGAGFSANLSSILPD
ncbi:hypothetical protein CSW58_10010 [Caulobacter sp. B11]|uniref:DUF6441 family protein n=1 Tax=Caulobacter sp. B11 TaxID=2048899 RepID=UPI000C12BD27|nr:DUF6441 family protein [Caulobacter sp. B11]PHY12826.1 hypothetical protein CSW58_10010 [Caulobacter sp. B11]